VGNATLADISKAYGLPKRLRVLPSQALAIQASENIQADVLEAYIGGLYLDQGMQIVQTWLRALFRPYVQEAYKKVKEQHRIPQLAATSPPIAGASGPYLEYLQNQTQYIGHLAFFNQIMQKRRQFTEWIWDSETSDSAKATPMWAVRAVVDGHTIALGRGNTKKAAANEAAREGLARLGIVFDSADSQA